VSTVYLKYRDTRPTIEVELKKPDGTAVDLTGTTVKMHIRIENESTTLTRTMTITGAPTLGVVQYPWVAADWTTPPALKKGDHRLEYEVILGADRQTYPNSTYDTLAVVDDLAQG